MVCAPVVYLPTLLHTGSPCRARDFFPMHMSRSGALMRVNAVLTVFQNTIAVDEEAKAIVLEKIGMTAGSDQDAGSNPPI